MDKQNNTQRSKKNNFKASILKFVRQINFFRVFLFFALIFSIAFASFDQPDFLAARNSEAPGCGSDDCLTVPDPGSFSGISDDGSIRQTILKWTNFFLGFLALVAMIALIAAGFMYVTAAGDQEQIEKAKKTIIWVVVGIVVILIAYALVNTLIETGPKGDDTLGG